MAMFHINCESDAFENPLLRNLCKVSHCMALLRPSHLSFYVHHYSRSTSAGIFMARLHTTAIFCTCHFLIFDGRPTFRHSLYSESDRQAGASPRPPRVCGGLKLAICGTFGDFRPFSSAFRQNGGQNYFRFRFFFSIDILISYLGLFSKYSWSNFNFGPFFRFSSKRRLRLFPFPVFTSDSNLSSTTLTTNISIRYVGNFSIYRGSKFKNSKMIEMSYKNFSFAIFRYFVVIVV